MTDAVAKPASTGGQGFRSRNWSSRLLQYVLLQALIVIVCVFALHQPLSEPPSRYLVTAFTLEDRGATRPVTLPDFVPSRLSMNDPALYRGSFTYDSTSAKDESQRAWSAYLPRFTNGVEVIVNGVEILDSRRDPSANRPDRATPEIALIPASLLRDGANDLAIKLYIWGPVSGFLDRLRAGSVDLAVLALPIRGHEFEAQPLFAERLFAALPKKHKLARRPSLQLADLRRDPFLFLRDGHCFRDTAVAACDRARLDPRVVFESGHLSSLLAMVGAGMGVSLVPEMAVDKSRPCRFVRIADPRAERTIAAVVLRGRTLNRGSRALLAHLR